MSYCCLVFMKSIVSYLKPYFGVVIQKVVLVKGHKVGVFTFYQGNLGNWKRLRLYSNFAAVWIVFMQIFVVNLKKLDLQIPLQSDRGSRALCFPLLLVWCYWDQWDQIYSTSTAGISNICPYSIFFLALFSPQTRRRIPRSARSTLSHAKTRTLPIVSTKGNALWSKPWRDPTNTAGKSPARKGQKTLLTEGGSVRKKNYGRSGVECWMESNGIFFSPTQLRLSQLVGFLVVCDNHIQKYVNKRSNILIFS